MKISVVVPFRNAGPYIGRAMRSIAEQTFQPFEVIAIDDGSTDDSVAQIQSVGLNIAVLQSQARNGAGTRNVGIKAAAGDWIAFLDADDYWLPTHLERAAGLLSKGEDIAYLSHSHILNSGQMIQSPCLFGGAEPEAGLSHGEYMQRYVSRLYYAMSPVVIQRSRLLEVGGLDSSQVRRHDIDMWLRVIAEQTWCFDPVATSVYQQDTPGAISQNIAEREWYFLRCLLRNQEVYRDWGIDSLIKRIALRVYSSAITDGEAQDRSRADELAWPHLSFRDKQIVRLIRFFPASFRRVNRWRREKLFRSSSSRPPASETVG